MISSTLFKKNMGSMIKLIIIFIAVLFLYDIAVIYMFDPELSSMLNEFQEMMPEIMALFGMTGEAGTLLGFLNTYLYGMLLMIFPMVFSIIASNKLIMAYVDRGSMASLLSTPNSRKKIILTQMVSIILGLFIIIFANMLLIMVISAIMFPGQLEIGTFIILNIAIFLVQLVISGITYFSACVFNEPKFFFMLGAGLPILFYVMQMAANMGGKLEKIKYFTLFTLFRNGEILSDGSYGYSFIVLFILAVILFISGTEIFKKKNLFL